MTPRTASSDSKSIRTFFIYAGIVLFFILLSLGIKTFFIIQQSKFDGENQFIVAISEEKNVKEIIVFRPTERSATILEFSGVVLTPSALGKTLGLIPDGTIDARYAIPLTTLPETMKSSIFNFNNLKTDLTLYDLIRLYLGSQKLLNNLQQEKIVITKDGVKNEQQIQNLFVDDKIFSENVSIQIVNASGAAGVGKRLERALSNLGGNIIAVSTSRQEERVSKIQYFGEETYTLAKLKRVLKFPAEVVQTEPIANIVIIIGEDQKNSEIF